MDNPRDLERLNRFLAQVMPIQVSSSLVPGDRPFWSVLVFYEGAAPQPKPTEAVRIPSDPGFEALRAWRSHKAKEEGVPPYVIATNAELKAILERQPKTLEELAQVKGFAKTKAAKYGREILRLLGRE
ncbi:HRDC domain-containing protein [Meiothermus taiwanensis]|uniref:HRDC domain-containing protein n=1 Tax=Meiothermus taiwanensis TaxID=172827 RepID=UPI001CBB645E|nr:HRDC domain-containing protein [Meiothermus taiwanensis]